MRTSSLYAAINDYHRRDIDEEDLPAAVKMPRDPALPVPSINKRSLKETGAGLIAQALYETASIPRAASRLGIHHTTLYRKLKKYEADSLLDQQKDPSA